ncbi:MAG: competence/damage-inducible protein [Planctomycetota bacterium]|nr:MAG: competence/damage-inducible protein [Planctomycetota bacterium]
MARHVAIPDLFQPLVDEIRAAARSADVVILSGGLGPTVDDLTREAAAKAAGKRLVRSTAALRGIRAFFAKRRRPMAANNERQADLPQGAVLVRNPVGTAPGFSMSVARALVIALPGVPVELRAMFDNGVAQLLKRCFPRRPTVAAQELETIGLAESEVDRRLVAIASPGGNPRLSLMVRDGIVTARFLARGRTATEARKTLAAAVKRARGALGRALFGRDGVDISDAVAAMLKDAGLTLSVAESCTGGLIGHLLTKVAGISAVLLEDVVTYSNESKVKRLGVSRALISKHGAVSAEVCSAMAEGSARSSGADAALSVTGIAGPSGGTDVKPVGLVYTAVHLRGRTTVSDLRLSGDRGAIQARAARLALEHLRQRLIAGS